MFSKIFLTTTFPVGHYSDQPLKPQHVKHVSLSVFSKASPPRSSCQTWLTWTLTVEVSIVCVTALSASVPTCAFMQKYQPLPFGVDDISGLHSLDSFFVEGAASFVEGGCNDDSDIGLGSWAQHDLLVGRAHDHLCKDRHRHAMPLQQMVEVWDRCLVPTTTVT
jgi:hypothetical protein